MTTSSPLPKKDPRQSMNSMYKLTRHVYDASRKFYLLGRDHLIKTLDAQPGEHIIEVGCGTARNLIKMAQAYPLAHFYGMDAADEMLKTARQSLLRAQLANKIPLIQGLAQTYDPADLLPEGELPDKIVFSYVLSMIPEAPAAIDHALDLLKDGGEIHIVDFGDLGAQPTWFRAILVKWLDLFHVHHDPELLAYIRDMGAEEAVDVNIQTLYNDYAYRAVIKKTSAL
ncbi:MAG: class I SAM-dependent methyltransferase [Rhodospirillales bacterium]|nr:class I SAM-dependent methyltransferase [Rhodospirillales bacterium]